MHVVLFNSVMMLRVATNVCYQCVIAFKYMFLHCVWDICAMLLPAGMIALRYMYSIYIVCRFAVVWLAMFTAIVICG